VPPDDLPAPDVVVVRLGPDDAGEVLTLLRAAYVSEARLHDDLDLPPLVQTLGQLRADLADPAVVTLGLRLRATGYGRLVGTARLAATPDDVASGVADVGRLAVVPDLQGRGLGRRLLELVEAARPPGVTRLRLFTGEHSESNIRLYRRAGYAETHRTPIGRYDLVHLAKDVPVQLAGITTTAVP
jgi:GNAT superfamily N-acetyltransferase